MSGKTLWAIGAFGGLLFSASTTSAQILPDEGRIYWSPGVPGGIPEYPVQYDVVADFGAVGDGVTDDTEAIRDAIEATDPGHAVYVPEGEYFVTGGFSLGSGVAIRGAGPFKTVIHSFHERSPFRIGGGEAEETTVLRAAAPKNSSRIQVGSTEGLATGDWLELQRPDNVSQIVEVADVEEGQLTLVGYLYSDFPARTAVLRLDMVHDAGVEDMTIHVERPEEMYSGVWKVDMTRAARSWVKNIETRGYSHEIQVIQSFQCEVRDSYFHHDYDDLMTQEQFGWYGVTVASGTSDALVENNILNWYRHALVIQNGVSGGNVFGYNLSSGMIDGMERSFIIGDMEFHHNIVEMTLVEGNSVEQVRIVGGDDNYAKRKNTVLRNRVTQSGIGTTSSGADGNHIIGNELPIQKIDTGGRNGVNAGGCLVHGNYVAHDDEGISWDPDIDDHEIPTSYYLVERPAWFCDLDWPALGGDLMPDNTRRSPAEVRFWTTQFPEAAPSELALEHDGDDVHLSWTSNSTDEVDFVVVRGNDDGYERIAFTTDTSYVDEGFADAEELCYYVRARNHLGGEEGGELGGESPASNLACVDQNVDPGEAPDCAFIAEAGQQRAPNDTRPPEPEIVDDSSGNTSDSGCGCSVPRANSRFPGLLVLLALTACCPMRRRRARSPMLILLRGAPVEGRHSRPDVGEWHAPRTPDRWASKAPPVR